ncbi:MAG: hypothetical protein R3F62_30555 [Planctomycetota bacterium]
MYPRQPDSSPRAPREDEDDEGFYDPLDDDDALDDDFGFEDDPGSAEEADDAFDEDFDEQDDGEPFAAPHDDPDDPF